MVILSSYPIFVHQNSNLDLEDETKMDFPPKQQKASSGAYTFRLRVALRSTPSTQQSTDEEEVGGVRRTKRGVKKVENTSKAKGARHVKFEGDREEKAVILPSPPEEHKSDSAEDVGSSFLVKREQNIKANRAMVNHKH